MVGGFSVEPDALRAQARDFFGESDNVARIANQILTAGAVSSGDEGLDALVARLIGEIASSIDGVSARLEVAGETLMANARHYEDVDRAVGRTFAGS